jgi:DNA invertase Pin-like site-specific DNA recombinase
MMESPLFSRSFPLAKPSDTSKVVGRLVGLVRISDAKGSEIESQKGVVEGFARTAGNSIGKWYSDLDRKRWEYGRSEAIRRLLADADAGLFDWVIVDKAQRIGTYNERELFHFLHEVERRRVRIWSVAEGDLMDPNVLRSLEMVLGSQSELKDQRNKAQNVSRGMRLNALEFRFNGAVLPYGYDRICRTPDGVERFRLIEDRREQNPDYVTGSKEPGRQRWLNWYTVLYPGDHEEHRIGPPGKGKHERYEFALSLRSERRKWAADIFRLYAEGLTRSEIATHLNHEGADLALKTYWHVEHITHILTNPIYGGRHEWRRQTWAIYSSILPDGTYEDVEERWLGPKRARAVEPEGVIRSSKVREDLRLVDDATLAKVAKRLAEEGAGKPDGRRGRSDSFWLQPFLRCGHCGGTMRGQTGEAFKGRWRNPCFRCSNYSKKYVGARRCVHNRIRLDEVERLAHEFLSTFDQQIDLDIGERVMPNLDRLNLTVADRGLMLHMLRAEMREYVMDRLPEKDKDKLLDDRINLLEAYRHYFDLEEGERAKEIGELEDQIGDLTFKAIAYTEGSVARRKLDERIAELEDQVRTLRAQQVPLDKRIDAAQRQLQEIKATIQAVTSHAVAKRTRQAAELLRGLLKEIVVCSIENPVRGGTRPDRVTDRVVFVPIVGEPMEFKAAPPKGSVAPSSVERARELWHEGLNLNQIARTLTKEELPTASGSATWHRGTLLRLLAAEIAASEVRRDGRKQPRRPTGPAARDAQR